MKKTMMLAALLLPMSALAADGGMPMKGMSGHDMPMHGAMPGQAKHDMPMKQGMKSDAFMEQKQVDGYTVSFHVMPAKEGMQHGASSSFMVKVEKDGKLADVVAVNSKAQHPNGQSESKMMMKMGDWYMASYDLAHKGEHQLMVLFKTKDGAKHFAGVRFDGK